MIKRTFARIILISNLIFFAFISVTLAINNYQPDANYSEGGVNYYLSAPNTFTAEISLLDTEHIANVTDGETFIIEWETEMPAEITEQYTGTFSYNGVMVSRRISITCVNTLTLHYSKNAFTEGLSFIYGDFVQQANAVEYLSAGGLMPFNHQFGFTDTIIRDFNSDNFSSINDDYVLPVILTFTSNEISNQYGVQSMQAYSMLSEYYAEIQQYEDLNMDILLNNSFISEIIEEIIPMPTLEIPDELPKEIPIETAAVEIKEVLPQNTIDIPQETKIELREPTSAEVIAGAISSAVVVGVLSAVAASASSSLSGAASSVAASTSAVVGQVSQTVVQSAAVGTEKSMLSFLSDVIKGLRDMFMDEGRAHASGKVTDNLHKD